MEKAIVILTNTDADPVLSPRVISEGTGAAIYFPTNDDHFGRVTFINIDAIRICRGEFMPYHYDYQNGKYGWVFKIENSNWLAERYEYEKKYYGRSYEFGGNVGEMLTDFNHYLFCFHDEFIEVIARGFWIEKDKESLEGRGLLAGHPFLDLPREHAEKFTAHQLTMEVRKNPLSAEELTENARFCPQILFQFSLLLDEHESISLEIRLFYRNGKLISSLSGFFGKEKAVFDGIAGWKQALPFLEEYMKEVYLNRKKMGK